MNIRMRNGFACIGRRESEVSNIWLSGTFEEDMDLAFASMRDRDEIGLIAVVIGRYT